MHLILNAALSVAMVFVMTSCGVGDRHRPSQSGTPDLVGEVLLGTQCPFGTLPDPVPGLFTLRDCPMSQRELSLLTPPGPIWVFGDCAEKTIGLRTLDGVVDTLWQVMPDGSFSLTVPGFSGRWSADLDADTPCTSSMTLEVSGKMLCENRDVFTIELEPLRLWMAEARQTAPSSDFGERHCRMPTSCRLETSRSLRQCG